MAAHATAPAIHQLRHTISIEDALVRISVASEALRTPRLVFWKATKSPAKAVWLLSARMTIGAHDLAVGAIDHKARPVLVVKLGMVELRPGLGLVARRTFATGLRVKNSLVRQERVAVSILVAGFTTGRGATKPAHVVGIDNVVAHSTVLLSMLAGEWQSRLRMHLNIKRVRHEVRTLVATNTILRC